MSRKLKRFSVFFSIFALVFFVPCVSRVMGAELEAITKVSEAEDALDAAYLSVLEAERTGGDVFELVTLLNTALEYYSEAERALESGEYEVAVQLADKAVETSKVVLNADISLLFVAARVGEELFRNLLLLSFSSICLIVLFGFLSWRLFKGYYIRRAMGLKSEVVAYES